MEDVPGSISRSQIVKAASRARRWLRGELKIDDPKVDAALEVIFAYRALHAAPSGHSQQRAAQHDPYRGVPG